VKKDSGHRAKNPWAAGGDYQEKKAVTETVWGMPQKKTLVRKFAQTRLLRTRGQGTQKNPQKRQVVFRKTTLWGWGLASKLKQGKGKSGSTQNLMEEIWKENDSILEKRTRGKSRGGGKTP